MRWKGLSDRRRGRRNREESRRRRALERERENRREHDRVEEADGERRDPFDLAGGLRNDEAKREREDRGCGEEAIRRHAHEKDAADGAADHRTAPVVETEKTTRLGMNHRKDRALL